MENETSSRDSTNNTQQANLKTLNGKEALEKLKQIVEKAENCFFLY
ncbi:MAG: hypothetical protein JWN56_2020 [Sphingobacteriales bacterium]|nr:hypothetical protein [Sphingobacteriales bacterium]